MGLTENRAPPKSTTSQGIFSIIMLISHRSGYPIFRQTHVSMMQPQQLRTLCTLWGPGGPSCSICTAHKLQGSASHPWQIPIFYEVWKVTWMHFRSLSFLSQGTSKFDPQRGSRQRLLQAPWEVETSWATPAQPALACAHPRHAPTPSLAQSGGFTSLHKRFPVTSWILMFFFGHVNPT